MAKISKEEINKISGLARIKLTQDEIEKYSDELSEILGFVEKLGKVDTRGINETSQVTGLENVSRADEASEINHVDNDVFKNREKLLANAPAQKEGYIKVKQILE